MADRSLPLTVFTTFYDNLRYFDQTVESVLSQSFRDFEFLMINDGDPKESERIRRQFPDPRIRIIDQPRDTVPRKRNRGLHEGLGEMIAIIDSDDCCEPGRFEKQLAFLRANPDHVVVGSALRCINEKSETVGLRSYPVTHEEIERTIVRTNCIAQPAVMARRQALIDAGGYTEQFPWADDYDLWLRVARIGKMHNLPEALLAYRLHPQATKNVRLKEALRDSVLLKIHAIRRYGYRATPAVIANIAMHAALLPLPKRLVLWLFRRLMVSGQTQS